MNTRLVQVLALGVLAAGRPVTLAAQAERWWADVQALAHDSMRGREAGSAEHRKAAEYVAAAFRRIGLAPAGTDGYFQPVRLVARTVDETRSRVTLVRDGREDPLTLGEDAFVVPRGSLAPRLDAPVVFVGYGLRLPEFGHDDLAGLDLQGTVVAYLSGLPRGIPGPVAAHGRAQAWTALRRAGAVGTVTFSPARNATAAWERQARGRLAPQMALTDSSLDAAPGIALALHFNALRAERLFAGGPHRFAALAARADSGLPLPRFRLPVSVRSAVALVEHETVSDNVAAVLGGSDPALRGEYVVLTAHLDHIGVGRPVNGDSIYNGAMDNASGTALLLETARALAEGRTPVRRSVLFLAVTAEEKGLLGSRWFANRPTVPVEALVANLNTDMFLAFLPLRMVMANGLEESDLAADAQRAGAAVGVPVVTDPEPEENRFIRSDQYSFVLRGIPALSLKIGFERDSPEHRRVLEFRATRYHLPADDAGQPFDLAAAERFAVFYRQLALAVANRDTRPAWNATSYFRRRAGGPDRGAR